jgi:D-amino-acid dehydrogenase
MKVVVVGGGAVGLAAAYYVAEKGAEVAVFERGRLGEATSEASAGWLTPGISSIPVAAPGVVPQALRWMTRPDSPFYIHPRLSSSLASFLLRFWYSSGHARFRAALASLVRLNRNTLTLLDQMRAAGVEFEMHHKGLLFACLSREAAEQEAAAYELLREAGFEGEFEVLDADAVHALEPGLSDFVEAGLYSKLERHSRPETLVSGLAQNLRSRGHTVREHAPVLGLRRTASAWEVRLQDEAVAADKVIVAAGVWSGTLLRPLGANLNFLSGKGYGLTFDNPPQSVEHPMYLAEAKVALSPYQGALRLGGTLELMNPDPSLAPRRLEAIRTAARKYLRDWRDIEPSTARSGQRPMLPDSLPAIGPITGHDGVFVCAGHGMVGITMSAPSGAALASVVVDGTAVPELAPFRPDRFRRLRLQLRPPARAAMPGRRAPEPASDRPSTTHEPRTKEQAQ